MGLIERYVLGRLNSAFLMTLAALAGVVWVTQALRQMSLVTAKGQTLLIFLEISLLAVPFLLVVIAPFAVLAAAIFTLNALNAESELVVVSASGGSRLVVLKPILLLAGAVALVMFATMAELAPAAQRQLRVELTKVNVDLIANIVRPGRFTQIEQGLTFHIRNRAGDGSLAGLVIDDQRDQAFGYTYIAEQAVILETADRTLLVMRQGVLQRLQKETNSLSIVQFEAYAFDLSDLTAQEAKPVFRPSERPTAELWSPDFTDEYTLRNLHRFRSEFHDRFSQPLMPLAFAVIVFLALGDPRTTRQNRGMPIVTAILAAALLRGAHFAAINAAAQSQVAAVLAYWIPLSVIVIGLLILVFDRKLGLPAPAERALDALFDAVRSLAEHLAARFGLDQRWGSR